MALPPLADVATLSSWTGEAIPANDPRALAVLAASSTLVRSYTGQDWVDGAELTDVPEAVATVTVQCAARVWRNPAAVVQDTTGPFTVRYSEGSGEGLFLTDSERAMLGPYRIRRPLWSQRVHRPDDYLQTVAADTVFVDVAGSSEPMPWYAASDLGED